MKTIFLVSEDTLKKFTNIGSNIDGHYIMPAIYNAQYIDLERLIGKSLLKKLQDLVADNSIFDNDAYKLLLDEYITPYLCAQVTTELLPILQIKLSNSGTTVNQDEKKYQMEFRNVQTLVDQYQKYADAYALKMKNYLDSHSSDYPEYNQCVDYSHKNDVSGCGIYLDDIPYSTCNYKYK